MKNPTTGHAYIINGIPMKLNKPDMNINKIAFPT